MYSKRTTLWFLGHPTLIVLGFAYRHHAALSLLQLWRQSSLPSSSTLPTSESCGGQKETPAGPHSSTLALLLLFGVPAFIIVIVVAREAVNAAHYLTRQSAEQGGFTLFLTTMAERGLEFLGRWIDISKYDIQGRRHLSRAAGWRLGLGFRSLAPQQFCRV